MKKSINLSQAIALYISAILGSGVLFLSAGTATEAGPASLLSWLIVVLFSFPLAYTFAFLSKVWPDAGGAATFVRMAFGNHAGNLVGWFYFLTAAVGQVIVSLTGASYAGVAFGLSEWWVAGLALVILLLGGWSNHCGIRVSGKVSLILSSILLFLIVLTIISTIPFIRWDHFQPFLPNGWISVGTAVIMIFWSFFGWEAICNLADRFKDPEKDSVPSAMISAAVIGVVFLLLSWITIGSGTYGDLNSDSAPLGLMIQRSLGLGAQWATSILAFIICTGTVNAFIASLTQLGYALSRDRAFPSWFYHLNPQTNTPTRVVWMVVLFASSGVVLTVLRNIHFTQLLFVPNSLGIVVYIVTMGASLKLFDKFTSPWITGLVSFLLLIVFVPFLGFHLLVPIMVGGMYMLYMSVQKHGKGHLGERKSRDESV